MSRKNRDSNVVRITRTVKMNAALILFGVVLVYVAASIIIAMTKKPITTYQISSSNINNNISCTGIALRSEKEVTSTKSGYLIYFVRDGDRVSKNAPVCTVDETGNVIKEIQTTPTSSAKEFTSADYSDIRSAIDVYKSSYKDEEFYTIYNFKGQIESKVMELSNSIMVQMVKEGGAAVSSTLESIHSADSGIIVYYVDGMEAKTPETLTESDFVKADYKKQSLKSGDIMNAGSTVFKIVTDENWKIVCQLTEEETTSIMAESEIRFTINGSTQDHYSEYEIIRKSDSNFLVLSLDKYMIDYIDERFLNIEIILNRYEGLKIPNSSIVEKTVYKVPVDYVNLTDPKDPLVTIRTIHEDGSSDDEEKPLNAFKHVEQYYYVEESRLDIAAQLVKPYRTETLAVSALERIQVSGVFVANEGIADFTEIEIVKSQDEFTIIKDGRLLKEYDNIVLDADEVKENQTLY